MSLFPDMPKRDQYFLVGLAFVFMLGQLAGAALNLWGWPSEWF